jgi:hypothetical protein
VSQGDQMPGRDMSEVILYLVQVLDQKIPASWFVSQQYPNFFECNQIYRMALWAGAFLFSQLLEIYFCH